MTSYRRKELFHNIIGIFTSIFHILFFLLLFPVVLVINAVFLPIYLIQNRIYDEKNTPSSLLYTLYSWFDAIHESFQDLWFFIIMLKLGM